MAAFKAEEKKEPLTPEQKALRAQGVRACLCEVFRYSFPDDRADRRRRLARVLAGW